jgi:hypothetical protein
LTQNGHHVAQKNNNAGFPEATEKAISFPSKLKSLKSPAASSNLAGNGSTANDSDGNNKIIPSTNAAICLFTLTLQL